MLSQLLSQSWDTNFPLNDFIVCLIETSDRIRQREDERKRDAEEWRRQRENQAASQRQADPLAEKFRLLSRK
jgi:hypothetical protein